jgi:hypothetical protein
MLTFPSGLTTRTPGSKGQFNEAAWCVDIYEGDRELLWPQLIAVIKKGGPNPSPYMPGWGQLLDY